MNATPKCKDRLLNGCHEGFLKVRFFKLLLQSKYLEHLGILDKLFGKIAFIGRHRHGKIRLGAPFSLVKVSREPIQKHIPASAMLDCPLNIENRLVTVSLAFVDNEHVMAPRNPYQI